MLILLITLIKNIFSGSLTQALPQHFQLDPTLLKLNIMMMAHTSRDVNGKVVKV